jgi:adenosylhomocysteine nucleosidase
VKILVTFAVEAEFAPWKKRLDFRSAERAGVAIRRAHLAGAELDFAVTGMGPKNAAERAAILMNEPYDLCIASGFAGALKSNHVLGDIVVARAVQQSGAVRSIRCDEGYVAIAAKNGANTIDALLSLDHVAATPEEKSRLAHLADACDMESFAVLSAAASRSIPAVAIRVISDASQDSVPAGVDAMLTNSGRVNVAGVVKFAAQRPLELPAVIRLGRNSKAAAETLARFLESYVRSLASSSRPRLSEELQGAASR